MAGRRGKGLWGNGKEEGRGACACERKDARLRGYHMAGKEGGCWLGAWTGQGRCRSAAEKVSA